MRIYLKCILGKFHPVLIWNDGALTLSERSPQLEEEEEEEEGQQQQQQQQQDE